ncbi:unnamed protein product [Rhizoctonia solani]|uniref:Benzoate 4-monooxygenase n=1 Tax=Rhizoctonia solani TaxID=456999 RepID=A0A8H2WFV0_9AGAM|nr:unnamed protein product [Rhizoctonia solani]
MDKIRKPRGPPVWRCRNGIGVQFHPSLSKFRYKCTSIREQKTHQYSCIMAYELVYKSSFQYSVGVGAILAAYYVVPYLLDPYDYRRRFSGPWLASFTNWWMASTIDNNCHSDVICRLHSKYGTFMRIGPNHISIADPEAHEAVYGHSSGLTKTELYNGFTNGTPIIFTATDKAVHTTKRRRVANVFSMQSVLEFEPRVKKHILELCKQWDVRCDSAACGTSGINWEAKDGKAIIDCCAQFAFLVFDIIGDLAVGSPFGLVQRQRDAVPMARSLDLSENIGVSTAETSVAGALTRANHMVMVVGVYPLWIQKILRLAPWHLGGAFATTRLFKWAVAAVNDRLARKKNGDDGTGGVDIIDKLLPVLNAPGSGMSQAEFIAEILGILVAGGDTTSNTLSGLCYYLAMQPRCQRKLQEELDAHIPLDQSELNDSSNVVPRYEDVKGLPYLGACIKETHRLQSVVGTGLPRMVPPGKTFTFRDQTFKAGSILSVPSYTTNRSKIWGHDADEFRPERWLEDGAGALSKYLVPFSVGPRACVGRNLATMDLFLIVATLFRRYEVGGLSSTKLHIEESFMRTTVKCNVSIKRR